MKKNNQFIFVLFIISMQHGIYLIKNSDSFAFLKGVEISHDYIYHNIQTLIWFLPIYFILNYFSGTISQLLHGYGILLVTRNYDKRKLYLHQLLKMIAQLFIFTFYQIGLNYFIPISRINISNHLIIMFLIYCLFLITIIIIQSCMELYIQPEISNLIVVLNILTHIIIFNIAAKHFHHWQYILIGNYPLGYRLGNGLYKVEVIIMILNIIAMISIIFAIKKIKQMDL